MTTPGSELISRLQGLINAQTRNEEREVGQQMAKLVSPDLERYGALQHAPEVFDLFRRARRDAMSVRLKRTILEEASGLTPSPLDKTIETISLEMQNWGEFDRASIGQLYLRHLDSFEELQRNFNKIRSRRSHLMAIFRPFKDKYVSAWDRFLDSYPTEAVRAEAASLMNDTITDAQGFDLWADRIYKLFVKASVYSPSMDRKVHDDRAPRMPVQLGLINEGSVEIYRGRWDEWLAKNRTEILDLINGKESEYWFPSDSKSTQGTYGAPAFATTERATYAQYMRGPVSQAPAVSVSMSLASNSKLNAHRTWVSTEAAAGEFSMWLSMLSALWSSAGNEVSASVKFSSTSGESEINVPPLSFAEASKLLPEVIKNYR